MVQSNGMQYRIWIPTEWPSLPGFRWTDHVRIILTNHWLPELILDLDIKQPHSANAPRSTQIQQDPVIDVVVSEYIPGHYEEGVREEQSWLINRWHLLKNSLYSRAVAIPIARSDTSAIVHGRRRTCILDRPTLVLFFPFRVHAGAGERKTFYCIANNKLRLIPW